MYSVVWRNHVGFLSRLLHSTQSAQCAPQVFQTWRCADSTLGDRRSSLYGMESSWTPTGGQSLCTISGMNPLQQTPHVPLDSDPSGQGVAPHTPLRSAFAINKNVKISPKKLNVVARLVRRMHVEDAFSQCSALPKKGARIVARTLRSACFNAVNNFNMNNAILHVDECFVTPGRHLKSALIHGRGKSGVRKRYYSILKVVVSEKLGVQRQLSYQAAWMDRVKGRRGRGSSATFVAKKIEPEEFE